MTDLPIIFSATMIAALLAGRKSQTRRIAGAYKPIYKGCDDLVYKPSPWQKVQPGDRLWVRENYLIKPWFGAGRNSIVGIECMVGEDAPKLCWHSCPPAIAKAFLARTAPQPSIHMPRWASRLTLIVEGVKVEPLQDIDAQDSIAEGVECSTCEAMGKSACAGLGCFASIAAFRNIWQRLHDADCWDANPEVVAVSFRVVKENIDRIEEAS